MRDTTNLTSLTRRTTTLSIALILITALLAGTALGQSSSQGTFRDVNSTLSEYPADAPPTDFSLTITPGSAGPSAESLTEADQIAFDRVMIPHGGELTLSVDSVSVGEEEYGDLDGFISDQCLPGNPTFYLPFITGSSYAACDDGETFHLTLGNAGRDLGADVTVEFSVEGLPTEAGEYILFVELMNSGHGLDYLVGAPLDPLGGHDLTYTVTPGIPDELVKVSGGGQTGFPDSVLDDPLVIRVVDSEGNGVPGVGITWQTGDGEGEQLISPENSTDSTGHASTGFRLGSLVQAYTITASATDLGEVEFTATAEAPVPDEIQIRTESDGAGEQVVDSTLTADDAADGETFYAALYQEGEFVGDAHDAAWTLNDQAAGTGSSFIFSETDAVVHTLKVYVPELTETIQITVTPGAIDSLIICLDEDCDQNVPSPVTVELQGEQEFFAVGSDAHSNQIGPVRVDWSLAEAIGSIDTLQGTSTNFTAERVDSGTLTADHADLDVVDLDLEVIGSVDSIRICQESTGCDVTETFSFDADQVTDGEATFWAVGYNENDAVIGTVNADWDLLGGLTTGHSYEFEETGADDYSLRADFGGEEATVTVSVTPGDFTQLEIRTDDVDPCVNGSTEQGHVFEAGEHRDYCALRFDTYDNMIGPATNAQWTTTGIGKVEPAEGPETRFTATKAGAGYLMATIGEGDDAISGTTEELTVEPGPLASITIQYVGNPASEPVTGLITTTDGKEDSGVWVFWAVGYDAYGNYRGPVEQALWETDEAFATVEQVGDGSAIFDPDTPGVTEVTASVGEIQDSTDHIVILHGALKALKFRDGPGGADKELDGSEPGQEIEDLEMTAGDTVQLWAAGYDRDENYLGDQIVDWSLSAECGELLPSGLDAPLVRFQATKVLEDECLLLADEDGLTQSIPVTVSPGDPVDLTIQTDDGSDITNPLYLAGHQQTMVAAGADEFGNPAGEARDDAQWWLEGSCGSLGSDSGSSIVFEARFATDEGEECRVFAQVTTGEFPLEGTLEADTGNITVNPQNAVDRIRIRNQPGDAGIELFELDLTTDDTVTVYAATYDSFGNYIGGHDDTTWNLDGDDIDFTDEGSFATIDPTTPGEATLEASLPEVSATLELTVDVGALASIEIRNSDGDPIDEIKLKFEGKEDLQAIELDGESNIRGDAVVDWDVVNDCGDVSTMTPSSTTTFTAGLVNVEGCEVRATLSGLMDTVPVAISPPPPDLLKVETSGGGGSIADLTDLTAGQSVTLHAAGYRGGGGDEGGDLFLDNFEADWTTDGDCGVFLVDENAVDEVNGATSVEFQPRHVDETACQVTTEFSNVPDVGPVQLPVDVTTPGELDSLVILKEGLPADPQNLKAATEIDLTTHGEDAWGNERPPTVVTWSIQDGDCGSYDGDTSTETATFRAETVGTCKLKAATSSVTSNLLDVTVAHGDPHRLRQELLGIVIPAGVEYIQRVYLTDSWDNRVTSGGYEACLDVPSDPNAEVPFYECKPLDTIGRATFFVTLYTSDPAIGRVLTLDAYLDSDSSIGHSRDVRVVAGSPYAMTFEHPGSVSVTDPADVRILVADEWGNPVEDRTAVSAFVTANSNLAEQLGTFIQHDEKTVDGAINGSLHTLSIDDIHEYYVHAETGGPLERTSDPIKVVPPE